jgi:hypothetical protein
MYICKECAYEFWNPLILKEAHGFEHPPYEELCVCPSCKSTNFEKAKSRFCHYCGAKLREEQSLYCNDRCKRQGERLFALERRRKKLAADSELFKIVREIDSYNKAHKTRISYGQYVAKMRFSKRGRKNEK